MSGILLRAVEARHMAHVEHLVGIRAGGLAGSRSARHQGEREKGRQPAPWRDAHRQRRSKRHSEDH
ncbi:MAG TPA: hypothetical protein VGI22_16690 [Xanthobacteraceae bacterium]|jgi:hypothetical protein